jgi:hypothetical protein
MTYVECSAFSDDGVEEPFDIIVEKLSQLSAKVTICEEKSGERMKKKKKNSSLL